MSGAQLVQLAARTVQWGTFRMATDRWIAAQRSK